jgi:UDP-N-acetylglucosamine/UDP-N-acetylgalactosamine diphosphorylase
LSFVTLGSLINFFDFLMTGGTSRRDHSEVGSGYIHFNYTPWGASGDKATPSLIGDVPRGVFMRENRIFLGGAGGLVGPSTVGFGAIAGAGQVVRHGVREGHLSLEPTPAIDRPVSFARLGTIEARAKKNVRFIANLFALRTWYEKVRRPMCPPQRVAVVDAAIALLSGCIEERVSQLQRFVSERGGEALSFVFPEPTPCPLPVCQECTDHPSWVKGLSASEADLGVRWLESIVESVHA